MAHAKNAVKPRRRYDATRRREQAERARDHIVEVAQRHFLEVGYAATPIATIATDAGVSVDTIYKTFGGKSGLLRSMYDKALRGAGPEPAELRSDQLHAQLSDPRAIIAQWGRFVGEIAPRATPLFLLLRSASATDPELLALVDEIDRSRHDRMTLNAGRLHRAGHLRPGLSVAQAADVLWTYSSPELYELLVMKRGMSICRYQAFVSDAMIAALLPLQGIA